MGETMWGRIITRAQVSELGFGIVAHANLPRRHSPTPFPDAMVPFRGIALAFAWLTAFLAFSFLLFFAGVVDLAPKSSSPHRSFEGCRGSSTSAPPAASPSPSVETWSKEQVYAWALGLSSRQSGRWAAGEYAVAAASINGSDIPVDGPFLMRVAHSDAEAVARQAAANETGTGTPACDLFDPLFNSKKFARALGIHNKRHVLHFAKVCEVHRRSTPGRSSEARGE